MSVRNGNAVKVEPLREEQRDALQEVVNIAMGRAGASLARVLNHFVVLSVPHIRLVEVSQLRASMRDMARSDDRLTVVRQSFQNRVRGEAIVLFGSSGVKGLADLMGYADVDGVEEQELLLDVANIVVGATVGGIGDQLGVELGYSAPSLLARDVRLDALLDPSILAWRYSLVLQIRFALEDRAFSCDVLMFMPESSIEWMRQAIDMFLEGL